MCMYALIYREDNSFWHLSNYQSMNTQYLEEIANKHVENGEWIDWRIEWYRTDYEWLELCDLVNGSNFGEELAAIILGIDDDWWYERNKKLIH